MVSIQEHAAFVSIYSRPRWDETLKFNVGRRECQDWKLRL